jgi:tRNA U38,U39,U40 pseudouridine synthase TruA
MRKYSKSVQKDVEREIKEMKAGTLKSGRSGKKVHSRKQAIAIALSEARREGKKVPDNPNKEK